MKILILKIICSLIGCGLCFISGYLFRMGTEKAKKNDVKEDKIFDNISSDWRKYND